MSQIIRYKRSKKTESKTKKPVTTEWKNARMIRTQSIKIASHEILTMSSNSDVVKVNIVGDTGSGKTELARALSHLLHKESKIPYAIRELTKDHLLNIKKFVSTLEPTNYILLFDDISFLNAIVSQREIKKIEQTFTELRHLPGGQDIKIIAIFNFHYTMGVSKYLRQSNAHFYTTIGSSDKNNVLELIGAGHTRKVNQFIRIRNECLATSKFTIPLGNKGNKFVYDFQKPFAPAFFFNGNSPRLIVYPLRTWISPFCNICALAKKSNVAETVGSIEDFDAAIKTKFGEGVIKQALRLKLYMAGISTYAKPVKRGLTFIDKYCEKNNISLEDLATFYGLKDETTKLRVDKSIFEPIPPETENA